MDDPATLEDIGLRKDGIEGQALYSRGVTEGWKDFVRTGIIVYQRSHDVGVDRRMKFVEYSWVGHAPSYVLPSPCSPDPPVANVHQNNPRYCVRRVKLDELRACTFVQRQNRIADPDSRRYHSPATGSGDRENFSDSSVERSHDTGDQDMPLHLDEEPDHVQDLSQLGQV